MSSGTASDLTIHGWLPAIECVANKLHSSLRFRLSDTLPYDPIQAIELCRFRVEMHETLDDFIGEGGRTKTAGFIDGENRMWGIPIPFRDRFEPLRWRMNLDTWCFILQ